MWQALGIVQPVRAGDAGGIDKHSGGDVQGVDALLSELEIEELALELVAMGSVVRLAPLMLGPHGSGAHQRTERVLRPHAFSVLPRLLAAAARALLAAELPSEEESKWLS